MLFLVIEHFKNGSAAVGQRFRQHGRMLPDGVAYQASWMGADGGRCYQIMEAASREALDGWIGRWNDLVDFEVVPVMTSADYWTSHPPE
jgi:hypothetical protein